MKAKIQSIFYNITLTLKLRREVKYVYLDTTACVSVTAGI